MAKAPSSSAVNRVAMAYLSRLAFNKYNAPELMAQLLAVLEREGLRDALNQIKMKKIPQLIEKAWAERGPSG